MDDKPSRRDFLKLSAATALETTTLPTLASLALPTLPGCSSTQTISIPAQRGTIYLPELHMYLALPKGHRYVPYRVEDVDREYEDIVKEDEEKADKSIFNIFYRLWNINEDIDRFLKKTDRDMSQRNSSMVIVEDMWQDQWDELNPPNKRVGRYFQKQSPEETLDHYILMDDFYSTKTEDEEKNKFIEIIRTKAICRAYGALIWNLKEQKLIYGRFKEPEKVKSELKDISERYKPETAEQVPYPEDFSLLCGWLGLKINEKPDDEPPVAEYSMNIADRKLKEKNLALRDLVVKYYKPPS